MPNFKRILKDKYICTTIIILVVLLITNLFTKTNSLPKLNNESIYVSEEAWAYFDNSNDKDVDTFYVVPTVYHDKLGEPNLSYEDDSWRDSFNNSFNKVKGIFIDETNIYVPFYEQVNGFDQQDDNSNKYFDIAYQSVREAFLYYMEHYNNGKPFILAGHSQGSNMLIRLLKEFSDYKEIKNQMVAAYCIGWRITEEDARVFGLNMAQGELDTNVIISYNSEAKDIEDSIMIPKGTKTLSINPLNWSTDNNFVSKSYNKGACFIDKKGIIFNEVKEFSGAYIDENRGSLIVTQINPNDYYEESMGYGVYHTYDYAFFYRNIEENVKNRIDSYFKQKESHNIKG